MVDRLSPADAVWFRGESSRNPMMVSSVLWFDRPLDVDVLRERVLHRLLDRHPVFRQRIVPSRNPLVMPRWVDDAHFDLDRHVHVLDLPEPGDHAMLEQWCSEQRSRPLDRAHPLWSVHVFQGYLGDRSAMHVRLHHSIGDGLALVRLLLGLSDEGQAGDEVPVDPPAMHLGTELVHLAGQSVAEASRMVRQPARALDWMRQGGDVAVWTGRLLAPPMPETSVLVGRPSGRKRMSWDPEGLSLDHVKGIGREVGATVNDVLLTVLTGALRHHLVDHDALVDEVLVMVPVNLRPPDEPLPRHLGNRIGLLPVMLPTGLAAPHERLAHLQAQIRQLRQSPAPVLSRALLAATSLLTPVGEKAIHRLNQLRSTGVVTNVPGPAGEIHLAGARVEGMIGWGGMTGHLNLGGAFISLAGKVYAGFVTDTAITPRPDLLLAQFRDEWQSLTARDLAATAS